MGCVAKKKTFSNKLVGDQDTWGLRAGNRKPPKCVPQSPVGRNSCHRHHAPAHSALAAPQVECARMQKLPQPWQPRTGRSTSTEPPFKMRQWLVSSAERKPEDPDMPRWCQLQIVLFSCEGATLGRATLVELSIFELPQWLPTTVTFASWLVTVNRGIVKSFVKKVEVDPMTQVNQNVKPQPKPSWPIARSTAIGQLVTWSPGSGGGGGGGRGRDDITLVACRKSWQFSRKAWVWPQLRPTGLWSYGHHATVLLPLLASGSISCWTCHKAKGLCRWLRKEGRNSWVRGSLPIQRESLDTAGGQLWLSFGCS